MIYLTLLKKFWWLVPVTVLCITAGTFHVQRDRAQAQIAILQADIAHRDAVAKAEIQVAHERADNANVKLESATAAANLLGADLASRVRDYENRLRSRPVRSPGQPVQAIGVSTPTQEAGPDVSGAIGDALAACARDSARLDNAVQWATSVDGASPL